MVQSEQARDWRVVGSRERGGRRGAEVMRPQVCHLPGLNELVNNSEPPFLHLHLGSIVIRPDACIRRIKQEDPLDHLHSAWHRGRAKQDVDVTTSLYV